MRAASRPASRRKGIRKRLHAKSAPERLHPESSPAASLLANDKTGAFRRNFLYVIPAVIACLFASFLVWQRCNQPNSPVQPPRFFTTSSADGQNVTVGRDVPGGPQAASGGGKVYRSVRGSLYKAYRRRVDGDSAVSANGRYALAFARYDDGIEEKSTPFTQKTFPFVMTEYWDSDFDAPVWKKELQLELLTKPRLDNEGNAYFVCIEPNIEAEGILKIVSIGGGGKMERQWNLSKLRSFGLDSPSLEGAAVSPNGRYFAATFSRTQDVLKKEPMRFLTFFFDLEKKRFWTDKREWARLSIDASGLVLAASDKRTISSLGEALDKHGLPME